MKIPNYCTYLIVRLLNSRSLIRDQKQAFFFEIKNWSNCFWVSKSLRSPNHNLLLLQTKQFLANQLISQEEQLSPYIYNRLSFLNDKHVIFNCARFCNNKTVRICSDTTLTHGRHSLFETRGRPFNSSGQLFENQLPLLSVYRSWRESLPVTRL